MVLAQTSGGFSGIYAIYYNVFEEKQSYNDNVSGKAKTKNKTVV